MEAMNLTLEPEMDASSPEHSIDPVSRRDVSTMTCLFTFKVALRPDVSVTTELQPIQRAPEDATANMAGNVISSGKLNL